MPGWSDLLAEANKPSVEVLRKRYLKELSKYTQRNVLVFYSGWLQVPEIPPFYVSINDSDKTGIMDCCRSVDRSKGLDIILHTPGGDIAATESIIDYLYSLYKGDIRAFIPQMAMSCGTLLAVSCKEIWMGRQSSIGPVDPQFGNIPALGIIEEFEMAYSEIRSDQGKLSVWLPILQKIAPTDIIRAKRAVEWSQEILINSLSRVMFKDLTEEERSKRIDSVIELLGQQKTSKSHDRHINADKARKAGLVVNNLEDDDKLQDLVLSIHHLLSISFDTFKSAKIIENNRGATYYLHSPQKR